MNTKNRAILWEETRVGGAIALVILLVGLAGQLPFVGHYNKGLDELLVLFPTLGFSLLTALLLTLSTANSGHLLGGFSPRILRLPVEIWSTVLIILLSRLAAVLAVSGVLAAASWTFFGAGPSADAVLLLGMAYLLIQVLDWLRAPAAPVVAAAIALVLLALLLNLSHLMPFFYSGKSGVRNSLLLALAFPPAVGVAYALSLVAVGYARRGAKMDLLSRLNLERLLPARRHAQAKPFSSPAAAQTWFERRRAGVFLPVATVLFWTLGVGLRVMLPRTSQSLPLTIVIWEVFPPMALFFAAILWHLRVERTHFWRRSRPASYFLRLPVEPVDLVRARLKISALSFLAVWAMVSLIVQYSFLTSDRGLIFYLLQTAHASGEMSGKEITTVIIGVPLLVGVVCWIAAHVPWSLVAIEFLMGLFVWALRAAGVAEETLLAPVYLMLALPLLWSARELVRARIKGLLPAWSLCACILIWAALAFALFPYGILHLPSNPLVLCLVSASIAALAVLPFPSLLLAAPGHLVGERSTRPHIERKESGFSRRRAAGLCALLGLLAMVAWVRSTTEPAFKAKLHAEGLPTTLAELNSWYTPVPEEANLATRYLSATAELEKLDGEWIQAGPVSGNIFSEEINRRLRYGLMVVGHSEIANTHLIPRNVWEETSDYWNHVGKPITAELHQIAQSGLSESRYPIDFTQSVLLSHLSRLMRLGDNLRLKALVAAVEEHPEDVAEAMSDMTALAESLKYEPLVVSQIYRMMICGDAVKALELAMNRALFTDEQLQRCQAILEAALPSMPDFNTAERTMAAESIAKMDFGYKVLTGQEDRTHRSGKELSPLAALERDAFSPALDALGWITVNNLVSTRGYYFTLDEIRDQKLRGYAFKERTPRNARNLNPYARAQYAFDLLYAFQHLAERGWEAHAKFATAAAAVAVERYRLANGRLPENLDQLVPQFLDRVPSDPFNEGAPLRCQIKEDGGYVVYTSLTDRKYDHMAAVNTNDNITFTVAPPELRSRPQVAEALPATPMPKIESRSELSEQQKFFHDMASKRTPQSQPAAVPGVIHGEESR